MRASHIITGVLVSVLVPFSASATVVRTVTPRTTRVQAAPPVQWAVSLDNSIKSYCLGLNGNKGFSAAGTGSLVQSKQALYRKSTFCKAYLSPKQAASSSAPVVRATRPLRRTLTPCNSSTPKIGTGSLACP